MKAMDYTLEHIFKSWEDLKLFEDFSVKFKAGIITCMLGPSGCGKTTLLNMLNGHVQPDSGSIQGLEDKRISYVFQEPRLLPWKTVTENVMFVLKGVFTQEEARHRAWKYLEMVELKDFRDYYPSQLSGGMKQRVSLARAFSYPADLILMDEPFSSLDARLKENLLKAFIRLWEIDQRTVVFVTHEPDEAIQVGHEIIVLSKPPVSIKKTFTKDDLKEISSGVREKIIGLIE
jgi:NitT/TauT family transport system ATP-binding protein